MRIFRSLLSLFFHFPVIPHELGHFIFRYYYGVYTEAIGIGDVRKPPLFASAKFQIHPASLKFQGGVMPLHQDRSYLLKHQQVITYAAGVFMDALCFTIYTHLISMASCYWIWGIFGYCAIQHFAQGIGNLIPTKGSDGFHMRRISRLYWLLTLLTVLFLIGWNFTQLLSNFL